MKFKPTANISPYDVNILGPPLYIMANLKRLHHSSINDKKNVKGPSKPKQEDVGTNVESL